MALYIQSYFHFETQVCPEQCGILEKKILPPADL